MKSTIKLVWQVFFFYAWYIVKFLNLKTISHFGLDHTICDATGVCVWQCCPEYELSIRIILSLSFGSTTHLLSFMSASPKFATSFVIFCWLSGTNKHTNTCYNTLNHLHGGPHCKISLELRSGLSAHTQTHSHLENNTSFHYRYCVW